MYVIDLGEDTLLTEASSQVWPTKKVLDVILIINQIYKPVLITSENAGGFCL